MLARHFLHELNSEQQAAKRFSDDALAALTRYEWPGNVRELKNVVRSGYILADEQIGLDVLPAEVRVFEPSSYGQDAAMRPGVSIAEAERTLIMSTLEQCAGNRTRAAELLGISVKTLYNRLKTYSDESS